ncbi:MAG: hypothetical protein QW613_07300 [Thermoprotei archaeon]
MVEALLGGYTKELGVLISQTTDPAQNLSLEATLFQAVEQGIFEDTLVFYVNSSCLVRGRTKSPSYGWYNEELATRLGIRVYTRITGGGVVYHDEGNLNWSFILRPKEVFLSPKKVFHEGSKHIVAALNALDLKAHYSPPNRIDLAGFKVSGMAAYSSIKALLVHGTLLVNTDLNLLNRLCIPPPGCPSVTNLSEHAQVRFGDIVQATVSSLIQAGFKTTSLEEADVVTLRGEGFGGGPHIKKDDWFI